MSAAAEDCASCNKALPKSEFMRCTLCRAAYDLDCINMSSQRFYTFYKQDKKRREGWRCTKCVNKKPKCIPISSPREVNNVTQRSKPASMKSFDASMGAVPDVPAEEFNKFWEEIRAVCLEMSMFRSAITELTATIKAQNTRLDILEAKVEKLETRIEDTDSCVVSSLEETIAQLKLDIEGRDQDVLVNDIEIANYPEINDEDPTQTVLAVARKLGVELEQRDVVSARRVGVLRAPADGRAPSGMSVRPRTITARLVHRAQRDVLLRAARTRRRLTVDNVVPGSPTPTPTFYINEHLTPHNRQLFQRARKVANRLGWKYVWTREGKIYVRQENGKNRLRLRSESDLIRVFGADMVKDTK